MREGDEFNYKIVDGSPVVNFTPKNFSDADIKGAFAVVMYDDMSMGCVTMSKKEIETTRQHWSKCPTSPAWLKAPGEMYKKTVLKRLTKMVELNFDNAEQVKAYAEGADLKKEVIDVSPEVKDPFENKGTIESADEPSADKPQDNLPTEKTEKEQINQVREEIENSLATPTKIFKYSVELMKKPIAELNLAEMVELKSKIEKQNPNGAI